MMHMPWSARCANLIVERIIVMKKQTKAKIGEKATEATSPPESTPKPERPETPPNDLGEVQNAEARKPKVGKPDSEKIETAKHEDGHREAENTGAEDIP